VNHPRRRGALRIVAGSARGRRIDTLGTPTTRPTSDRVREAMFNALESMGALDDVVVLDAFAGSGALGIEALSRGARHATFADTDAGAAAVVRDNLATVGFADRATVVVRSGERAAEVGGPYGLVLLDPPYAFDGWAALLASVTEQLDVDGVVVCESDRELVLPASLRGVRSRTYGGTVVQFATAAGAPS